MFIDKASIQVKAGTGGDGSAAFRREKYIPRGGPNGGDGGRGGDVYFRASDHLRTLLDFSRKREFTAENGEPGGTYLKSGKSGDDLILEVPCGTTISNQEGDVLADLLTHGESVLIAKGGRGGRGNTHFKSAVRQAPKLAERGAPGDDLRLKLQLKLIADVGFVGFPNAGKSTLLSRLTRAHPKIANYPFTTLYPNLGVAVVHHREIVFADIPGLIEGSHTGKGLGHEFLRHIERTRLLVHVVDPLGYEGHSPKESIKVIMNELKSHAPELAKKPRLIAVNKQDLTDAEKVFKDIKKSFKSMKVVAVSGVTGQGIPELLDLVGRELAKIPQLEVKSTPRPVHVKLEPGFWVEKEDEQFVVKGKRVERLIAMTFFKYPEAVERTQSILKKMGVEKELKAHGAKPGDPVKIGPMEFTFEPAATVRDRYR